MLGPDLWRDRRCRLIAIIMRRNTGRRIVTEMAVNIDDAGGDVFTCPIDPGITCWNRQISTANAESSDEVDHYRVQVGIYDWLAVAAERDRRGEVNLDVVCLHWLR